MDRMEQRVRDSLRARAADVEPSTELWDDVGERIARRQRWRVSAWALAGATAVAVGVLVVPGLLGGGVVPPEIAPWSPSEDPATEDPSVEGPTEGPVEEPEDPSEETSAEDPGAAGPDDGPEDDDRSSDPPGVVEPVVAVHDSELVLLTPDGTTTLVSLPEEGHSIFLSVAVRPGSTIDDLTVVTTTSAEGFHDLRWTRVVDGEVEVAFEAFEDPYAPAAASDEDAWVSPIVWAPDGGSVAWLDQTPEGVTLRTVGWDDGPGTDRTADDDASFDVDPLPSGAMLDDWVALDDTRSLIRATMADSNEGWYGIPMERQGDGALAAGSTRVFSVDDPSLGPAGAVGGETEGGEPRWVLRLGFDGAVLSDVVAGTQTDVPDGLLPGDGFAELWLRPHGEGVIVGSRNQAASYLVVDGETTPIEAETTDLAPIR